MRDRTQHFAWLLAFSRFGCATPGSSALRRYEAHALGRRASAFSAKDVDAPPAAPEPERCKASAPLPELERENAAWVEDVSKNVAFGLQVLSCAEMARDTAPVDLFGTSSFVACGPPRLCSAGADRKRESSDDVCVKLVEGHSSAPRRLALGWVRRFLQVIPEMRPGCDAADAAVVHFYAGLMRGDGSHLAALPPRAEWTDVLAQKMKKYERFHVRGARLQGLACSEAACRFEVWLEISRTPESRGTSGVDQGVVERMGDHWAITRPPT